MHRLSFFSFGLFLIVASGQQCPPTEVVFLLDQSENAKTAASQSNNFDLLQRSITSFVNNPKIRSLPDFDIRIGAYGYSGGSPQSTYIPEGSSPNQAIVDIPTIGSGPGGGSRTYRGLEMITTAPRFENNLVIVVSSMGSDSDSRRASAIAEYNRVIALGWNVYVVAVKGQNAIDMVELTAVNNNIPPVVLDDQRETGYTLLSAHLDQLINTKLCTLAPTTTTTTTTTTTPRTTTTTPRPTPRPTVPIVPRSTSEPGVCSECIAEGGFLLTADPSYCDRYYLCIAGQVPISKLCPAGTFFDGDSCNHRFNVKCNLTPCGTQQEGFRYESGRCCNQFYECRYGKLIPQDCPNGQVFDVSTKSCVTPADTRAVCQDRGMYMCNVDLDTNTGSSDCQYSADVTGDPCKFWFNGWQLTVPAGTVWKQEVCSIVHSTPDVCSGTFMPSDRLFDLDADRAAVCNAVFKTTFDNGDRTVFSERMNQDIDVYSVLQEARLESQHVTFTPSMTNPYLYYYFFNNMEIPVNTAFRVRFKLENFQYNTEYDIMSNNYCSLCDETISFTALATSPNDQVVTATFMTSTGRTVTSSAVVRAPNASEELELTVVYGDAEVYGEVSVISSSNPSQSPSQVASLKTVSKDAGATIATNKCGLQFGRGPTNTFVGYINDFAIFEYCEDISSILRQ